MAAVAETVRRRALELAKTLSLDEVVAKLSREGMTVCKSSVRNWVVIERARQAGEASGREGHAGQDSLPRRVEPSPVRADAPSGDAGRGVTKESSRRQEATSANEEGVEDVLGLDPTDLDMAELRRMARQLGKFLDEAISMREERRVVSIVKLRMEVSKRMMAIKPPAKVDPLKDPASLEARTAILDKLRKMVANAV